ncbi:MAG: arabinofuranosidase catalytic domain-containing protein [Mucilaginibacter sp.]
MKKKNHLLTLLASALVLPVGIMMVAMTGTKTTVVPARPEGPCDIYAAGGTPCTAAHSSTRALYASYNGPLYQVMRRSDGKTKDIGVVQPSNGDAGGYANAAAQDAFCSNTTCWITILYDQSGKGNNLVQAPHGGFSGPAMGGFNNLPIADMAPITIMGHKAYGVFIIPGMGMRLNDAKGTAVDDQAEGQYWVINGKHYNSGCCFDYGNAETDSRDDGDGTMETAYYGNAGSWYRGEGKGPWVMTDQENNLVGCVNASPNDKNCPIPTINWSFVTAMADGEPHHWRSMGGDAQRGDLMVMYDGGRIKNDRNSYDPMRKQGAILLGNGGDNSNGSQGTFYEGAITAGGTFPTKETNAKIQANVVASKYDVALLSLAPAALINTPPGLQTFAPGSSQNTIVTFTNTTGAPVKGVTLSIIAPKGWSTGSAKKFTTVAAGQSVNATFKVTSGPAAFNGDLVANASWTNAANQAQSEKAHEKLRNVSPVKINEFRINDGSTDNTSNSFVELYNAGKSAVDISNWSFTQHATQTPIFSNVKIPAGTKIAAKGFYLLGLSNSGLAVAAKKGESTIYVRSTTGMSAGDVIKIGEGATAETRKIASIATPEPDAAPAQFGRPGGPSGSTLVWQPVPEGPVITIPAGSTSIPVSSVNGFKVGQKMAIGHGAKYPAVAQGIEKYEIVTITGVGKPGTQAYLSADAKAGSTNIKVSSTANISVGDQIRLDIDSKGHGIETVTVTKVGTQSVRNTLNGPLKANEDAGTGLELAAPLKYDHASNMPFGNKGTGISFEPASAVAHSSNEPVLALNNVITLDRPLANNQEINAVVYDAKVKTAGYQGKKAPNQWIGGPALANSGSMRLSDAKGNIVDGLNYGGVIDPWLGEGWQLKSGPVQPGNFAAAPTVGGGGFRFGNAAPTEQPNKSAGRYPDGFDSDDNRADFMLQSNMSLSLASAAGAANVKFTNATGFNAGEQIIIGSDANSETAVIASIGTPGGTTVATATDAGATVIPVASAAGFVAGQTITIGNETATVASVTLARRGGGPNRTPQTESVTVTAPLKNSHAANTEVAGSGITFTKPLAKAHTSGTQVANYLPTPGAPNQYTKR